MFLISLKLISFNLEYLNLFLKIFNRLCLMHKIKVNGPIFCPKVTKKFIFLKAVHIYKKAGVSFAFFKYSRLFYFHCLDYSCFYKVFFFLVFIKYRLPLGICIKFMFKFPNI